MNQQRCAVIGVLDNGADGLSPSALQSLKQADVVIGGTRTLTLFADNLKAGVLTRDLSGNLSRVPEWIRTAQDEGLRCAVLATGDPLCHGIASFLAAKLCVESLEVMPNISTIQLACARLCLPWQDMKIVSVHTKDAGEWYAGAAPDHGLYALRRAVQLHERLAVLTSPDNTPDRIARLLVMANLHDSFQIAVAENLATAQENIVVGQSVSDIANRQFADPNVVLLWRTTAQDKPVRFGYADDKFQQRYPEKGLITKREARAVSLARLQLRADSIVWDIGAGSGSVGVEAALLCPMGHVFSVEKNEADCDNARANSVTFGLHNYSLVHAKAPEGLDGFPDPDAVFIGGSGGELSQLIALIIDRLQTGGHLVMNFVTFENLSVALETLKKIESSEKCFIEWDITQLQSSRSKPILDMQRLAAENPVFIVCVSKKEVA